MHPQCAQRQEEKDGFIYTWSDTEQAKKAHPVTFLMTPAAGAQGKWRLRLPPTAGIDWYRSVQELFGAKKCKAATP